MTTQINQTEVLCVHCGVQCEQDVIVYEGLPFCCHGCETVFKVLSDHRSGNTSNIQFPSTAGYEFLEEDEIQEALIIFKNNGISKIRFRTPAVHCSSCVQILEKLNILHNGIVASRIDFPRKEVTIDFCDDVISLRQVADLLTFVGYPPEINLATIQSSKDRTYDHQLLLQIGSAGFIFGNVMLLSFPEYFGLDDPFFERLFGYLSLAFCIPLLTYSASDYLRSAYTSLLNGSLNIDVPISLGALVLFLRSAYDIMSQTGGGYLDSLSGFIFFLLIGKWFQKKTYDRISFDRNYESYFPLFATKSTGDGISSVLLKNIVESDELIIRHQEIIPCDSKLLGKEAQIDYSFVTGEDRAIHAKTSDKLFAGGRNLGASIKVKVLKTVDQSYLTKLWEDEHSMVNTTLVRSLLIDKVGKYFTLTILGIALITIIYWMAIDPKVAMHAFTSVLIIACPCVIALSIPFTFGSLLSMLGTRSVFIRGTHILEKIQSATTIVFDKTGTITSGVRPKIDYVGKSLTFEQKELASLVAQQSSHPLSQFVFDHLGIGLQEVELSDFNEVSGMGVMGRYNSSQAKLGSMKFVEEAIDHKLDQSSYVHLSINGEYMGHFKVLTQFRPGLSTLLDNLRKRYQVHLLSGDLDFQKEELMTQYGFQPDEMQFGKSPQDKMSYINDMKAKGDNVIMIGDGLNDAGALRASDVGFVITEDLNNFTPASDVVIHASMFKKIVELLELVKGVKYILYFIYFMAIIYNGVGLFFAVQGLLSPVVAAILMPASSISMVVMGYGLTWAYFRKSTSGWKLTSHLSKTQPDPKLSIA